MLPSLLAGRSPFQHQEPHRHVRTGSPCEKEAIQRSCPSALRKRCCFGAHSLSCGPWVFYSSSFFPLTHYVTKVNMQAWVLFLPPSLFSFAKSDCASSLFRAYKCPWTALMLLKYRTYPCSAWLKGSHFNLRFIPSSVFSTWCTEGAKTHGQIVVLACHQGAVKGFFQKVMGPKKPLALCRDLSGKGRKSPHVAFLS